MAMFERYHTSRYVCGISINNPMHLIDKQNPALRLMPAIHLYLTDYHSILMKLIIMPLGLFCSHVVTTLSIQRLVRRRPFVDFDGFILKILGYDFYRVVVVAKVMLLADRIRYSTGILHHQYLCLWMIVNT